MPGIAVFPNRKTTFPAIWPRNNHFDTPRALSSRNWVAICRASVASTHH
ncbi:hypothetical protein MNO14_10980 [Luteimonas sp. S4-F44]|nr:hypothetical protein [Luteimonas sp. S4-F44]UNK41493.1 hypothetical protein MNO14_10980 [Luteimonas sp. S4-F44]